MPDKKGVASKSNTLYKHVWPAMAIMKHLKALYMLWFNFIIDLKLIIFYFIFGFVKDYY